MLADLQSPERRTDGPSRRGAAATRIQHDVLELLIALRQRSRTVRPPAPWTSRRTSAHCSAKMQLPTAKPVMGVCNVDEESAANGNALSERRGRARRRAECRMRRCLGRHRIVVAQLGGSGGEEGISREPRLNRTGLERVIRAGYEFLGLYHLFPTAGPKESRAWTIPGVF